jgi:hypothetical protein
MMSINCIPNDPLAIGDLPIRKVTPRPDRPANRAGLILTGTVTEDTYDVGTPEFLFWQSREACLAAIEAWESLTDATFKAWQANRKLLKLAPDEGVDLNAFYDRRSLSFFHSSGGGKTYFSGASTDVVAHETGHGILDSFRPEFWDSNLFEVNSFHEAFGDCVALLTAFNDKETRVAVLSTLEGKNFVEGTAEELSDGIRVIISATHNAAAPRRARSRLKHAIPSTLPDFGSPADGPGKLINEIHSFAQIFSGCFYDTIVNIYKSSNSATERSLLTAAQSAGRLLFEAASQAPQKLRFFREVGRAMILADQHINKGANETAIRGAFEGHGIPISLGFALSPETALDGGAPKLGASPKLATSVKRDLMRRLGAVPSGKAVFRAIEIGKVKVGEFVHQRAVELGNLDKRLEDVVAMAPQTVLLGDSGGRAAVLGMMPQAENTIDEVHAFVRSLVRNGAIDFGDGPTRPKAKAKGLTAHTRQELPPAPVTHVIKKVRGQKMLVRVRFVCGCGSVGR